MHSATPDKVQECSVLIDSGFISYTRWCVVEFLKIRNFVGIIILDRMRMIPILMRRNVGSIKNTWELLSNYSIN